MEEIVQSYKISCGTEKKVPNSLCKDTNTLIPELYKEKLQTTNLTHKNRGKIIYKTLANQI